MSDAALFTLLPLPEEMTMLFFDLEAYAPPGERMPGRSSLIVNPARPGHQLLGGAFVGKRLGDPVPKEPVVEGLWLWQFGSEKALLHAIHQRFEREWDESRTETGKVLGKSTKELIACGAGIAKFDLPALYCRSLHHQVAPAEVLYETFLKGRPIDIANEASFLFPEDPTFYPKSTKEVAGRLGIAERKGDSRGIWQMFEEEDHAGIEARTAGEVLTILEIYVRLQKRVQRMHGRE